MHAPHQSAAKKETPGRSAAERPPAQRRAAPNHTGLPDSLKTGVEQLSGQSLDHVRVHRNSPQPAQLQAHAYAQGGDIHLAPGQEKHLPHEAWHVAQQAQGRVKPTVQLAGGVPVNDDAGLEREADVMGAQATRLGAASGGVPKQLKIVPGARQLSRALRQTATIVQKKVAAKWTTNSKDTVITEANGTETKRQESDGVVATVKPGDYDSGSVTTAGVRPISQAATRAFGISFIAGHMLNKHLGGPGNEQENITAITSQQNSQHHSGLEKAAKDAVKPGGKTITYVTKITERANFTIGSGSTKRTAVNLASRLQGSFAPTDGSSSGQTLDIALGPPNATKAGASGPAEAKVNELEQRALDQANDFVTACEDMETAGKIKILDLDDLRAFAQANSQTVTDKLFGLAVTKKLIAVI